MSSHWLGASEEAELHGNDLEQGRHLAVLFERTLDELLRKPDLNSVIASTKAWCRGTWFTDDGHRFYLRDERGQPDMDSPPSSREEVTFLAQEEYRRLLRYMQLYDRFLQPKIKQVVDRHDLSKAQKTDRVYWIRLRFPAHVACKVPVLVDGNIDRFCWGWDYHKHQKGYVPSESQQRSDRLINRLFVDTSVLWSY